MKVRDRNKPEFRHQINGCCKPYCLGSIVFVLAVVMLISWQPVTAAPPERDRARAAKTDVVASRGGAEGGAVAMSNACPATNAGVLSDGSTIVGSTIGSTDNFVAGCGAQPGGQDEIFEFSVDLCGTWTFDSCTVPTCWDTTLEIREETGGGCPGDFTTCDDDGCVVCYFESAVSAFLNTGTTYYLIVDGWSSFQYGDFTITASLGTTEGCCTTDDECNDEDKCTLDRCDTSSGECSNTAIPGCCESDGDCPNKCSSCDTAVNECFKRPGCCTTDAQCPPDPKCFDSLCDLTTNTCELSGKLPGCCTSDAQCPPDEKCRDSFCNLTTNTCELSGKFPGCCSTDAQCPQDDKCFDHFCDLITNTCDLVKFCPPPRIWCPEPITLERGDRLCRPAVDRWLDSAEAHDGCDDFANTAGRGEVRISHDAPGCGFPFDSTTEVTWTATDNCGHTSECSSTITIGKAERVDSTTKGSLLVISKIEIKWDAAGNVTQDTFIDLTNDYPRDVVVQMYFINGDAPTDAVEVGNPPVVVERTHPGWNWVDCQIMLTKDQPTYWSALTGSNSHGGVCQPFTVLDPGSPPGRPDPDGPPGSRILRGYVYAWAVNNAGEEIRWNHLKADVILVNYEHTTAWEYNAYALTASCVDHGDQPWDCTAFDDNGVCCQAEVIAGRLDSDGFQYALSFDKLLLDFYASGSSALSDGGATVQIDTDLTLYPVSADLRQDTRGPVNIKAHFDIWNQNEVRLSGTHRCISCWDQTLLSKYTLVANHFMRANLQTDKGKARINGESSNVCEANPGACDEFRDCLRNGGGGRGETAGRPGGVPIGDNFFECRHEIFDGEGLPFDCTVFDPLLGVSAKLLMFSGTASGRAYAGSNLVGQGEENARILYDIIEPPDQLIIGPRDGAPIEADVADNPRINRTPAGASKRGR